MTEPGEGEAGVYLVPQSGEPYRVHTYIGGDYLLEDVVTVLQLGRLQDPGSGRTAALRIGAAELTELRTLADYYSFDLEEGFIRMCQEMAEWRGSADPELRFEADF